MKNPPYPQEIHGCEAFVSYRPLPGEPDPLAVLPFLSERITYVIAPQADLDPAAEAIAVIDAVGVQNAGIFIPGSRFDVSGTRHGRGGGWYDRFLAQVPSAWIRIGLCAPEQFSAAQLVRESWDQPVDYICVVGDSTTWHRTGARS